MLSRCLALLCTNSIPYTSHAGHNTVTLHSHDARWGCSATIMIFIACKASPSTARSPFTQSQWVLTLA
ncbi:hypothetical protein K523DRAFT_156523 [Schizophyllum commune Tattone D]|nr:hypothetical protein K523DRAFT_156523 [Schizophyllum commune Tattone D]